MNSSSVRVECPIVNTMDEGSGLGFLFPRGPGAFVLIPAALILKIFRIADATLLWSADRD